MAGSVTVYTSAAAGLVVPFSSPLGAIDAQAILDIVANPLAQANVVQFTTLTVGGSPTLPSAVPLGGIADRTTAAVNLGVLGATYRTVVNQGGGQLVAIGSVLDTTVVSSAAGTLIFGNQAPASTVLLGGGNNVVANTSPEAGVAILADGPGGIALGQSTLLIDNSVGGTVTATVRGGVLASLYAGGGERIIGQSGTAVILTEILSTMPATACTVAAAGADTTLWVGVGRPPTFITPGAGSVFVASYASIGTESTTTLFGGARIIGGQTLTAPAMTGRTTVLGMLGYLESGGAGGSIMSTGTTQGAATLVAGGDGDILFVNGVDDSAVLGDRTGIVLTAGRVTVGGGVRVTMGGGSGQIFGAVDGYNDFVFTGAGAYTVSGFHDNSVIGSLPGSSYRDAATGPGGAGSITITDFLPRQSPSGAVFDRFDLGAATLANLSISDLGGGRFDNVATLSDGTVISFRNTFGQVHLAGTLLV